MDSILKQEKRDLKKKEKKEELKKARVKRKLKKILNIFYTIIAVVAIIWGISSLASNTKKLPPTSMQGHIEESPASHILTEEMPENIQRHMLEHADGNGDSGVIVQYNCEKFECESDLVKKLAKIVKEYPTFVYLAPSSEYDGKIILTRPGKIKVLDEFNEKVIKSFIIN
jgi:cell division protein FtsL